MHMRKQQQSWKKTSLDSWDLLLDRSATHTFKALASPMSTISPWVGFFCAELGNRIPLVVLSSSLSILTKTLSPTGATFLYCKACHINHPFEAGNFQTVTLWEQFRKCQQGSCSFFYSLTIWNSLPQYVLHFPDQVVQQWTCRGHTYRDQYLYYVRFLERFGRHSSPLQGQLLPHEPPSDVWHCFFRWNLDLGLICEPENSMEASIASRKYYFEQLKILE